MPAKPKKDGQTPRPRQRRKKTDQSKGDPGTAVSGDAPAKKSSRPLAGIWRPVFLQYLRATGSTIHAAREAGVSESTIYWARKQSKEFREQWDAAKAHAVDMLLVEARRRAIRGVDKPIYYRGQKVGTVKEFSDRLLEILLKAHYPRMFRENYRAQDMDETPPVEYVHLTFDDDE